MQLLPAVEDGGPALIVQLQVRQSFFSSKGLKDDCGIDSYLSLVNELRKTRDSSKQYKQIRTNVPCKTWCVLVWRCAWYLIYTQPAV